MQQFDPEAIGARIAQARREADGMTQETLADLIGLSKRSIQDYESGATIPWKQMREIARVLDRHVDWFMRGDASVADPESLTEFSTLLAEVRSLRHRVEQNGEKLDRILEERAQPG